MRQKSEIRGQRPDGWTVRRMTVGALCCLTLVAGCTGPRVVFLPAPDAPVRAGPDLHGRVYVWTGRTWELSRNSVAVPEGFYIWDAGDPKPTTGEK